MKLDWKKLLFGLFVGVGMTMMPACSNDEGTDIDGGGQGTEVPEPTETGYLSMKLSLGSAAGTKADPGTEVGRAEEQTVREVWLVLYGVLSNEVEYFWKLDANNVLTGSFGGSDVSTESMATSSRFVTVGKPVAKKNYKMVVLVNPLSTSESLFLKGQPVSNLELPYENANIPLVNRWAKDDNFFMSNSQSHIIVEITDIKKSAKDAERNPKPVLVDRGVAKVVMDATIPTAPGNDVVENFVWGLDVTNRYSFWLRHGWKLSDGDWEEVGDGSSRYERYALDPNFKNCSQATDNGNPPTNQQFNYLDERPYNSLAYTFGGNENYAYVAENTMDADEQYQDVTTRVVIGCHYIPADKTGSHDSFFTFAGHVISMSDMWNYEKNPSQIPAKYVDLGLKEAMAKVKEKYPYAFDTWLDPQSFSYAGINFYYDGICYYTVLIRHFGEDQVSTPMGYGRYGVVRNNVYYLKIKNLSGIGSPIVEKPGPEPNDGTPSIAADIQVLPWQIREQIVEDL